VFQPDKPIKFNFQAMVTVTDHYGRKAVAEAHGTNDVTPLPDLERRLDRLWAVWRPTSPLPDPDHPGSDPLAREVARALHNIKGARADDAELARAVHASVESVIAYGYATVAAERGLRYARLRTPVYKVNMKMSEHQLDPLTAAARVQLAQLLKKTLAR
jgi:hypothetical protein